MRPLPARPDADRDLVLRALARDESAWRALVERHGAVAWGLCRRLDPDPEDAFQDVWVKVLAALDRFDPDGEAAFGAWVTRVAQRVLVDRHRRRAVRGDVLALGEIPTEPVPSGRLSRGVEQALAALPPEQRRVVLLHHLHDVPLGEIAEGEGVAVGTVKSRLHRARALLVQLLGRTP